MKVVRLLLLTVLLSAVAPAFAEQDWPMWRGDAARSAAVKNSLPSDFQLQWVRRFTPREQAWDDPLNLDLMTYDRVFEPIVFEGLVCIGFNEQDKLVALDVKTGKKVWTYYAEGPVRLPPVGWNGKIFFCSDDGFLYCVNARDGSLAWRFHGAPNKQHAIGNQRLTSAWPARGGPVVYDGTVYFAASIWPFMGTFIYALDASSGDIVWVNDRTGAQYIKQPHSAPSFAGVAPQGAMAATKDLLIVPGGRSVPAVFDRHTGELKYFEINAGGKGTGGSFVTADALHYYVHTREKGTRAFNLQTGAKTAFAPNEPVLADGLLYSAETIDDTSVIRAYDVSNDDNRAREPLWEVAAAGANELILADDTLVAAAGRTITLVRIPTKGNALKAARMVRSFVVDALRADESVARLLVAAERLFVVGDAGTVCSLGAGSLPPSTPITIADATPDAEENDPPPGVATSLLNLGQAEGYAFWFGRADAPEVLDIVENSPFEQLAVVDHDQQRVDKLRKMLDDRGLLGRVTAHVARPTDFRAPKYVGHMVFMTSEVAAANDAVSALYDSVRPYGGTLVVVDTGKETATLQARVEQLRLDNAECKQVTYPGPTSDSASGGSTKDALVVTRVGALPGSADWTHQYGDIANTVKSNDRRVKLPLGILWFGGSSNMDVLPRHGHGPPEQVVGGRLVIQGMNSLSARDVYTGRVLWKREFEDLGTYDVYYDVTYEDTPLNPKYNQVHIPGANGRGTNYVVTDDRIYLLVGATCLMLDPATGKDVGKIELPKNDDGSRPEWGYLGVYENILLGGLGFANYRERHHLEFASDGQLKRNRAGFGSKSFDRSASRGLVAFNRHTGEQLWRVDASHSFWHNGVVAGGGRVYCLDKNPTQIEEAIRRRGRSLPDSYRIVCLDAADGSTKWEVKEGVFGTWLGYSQKHDLLLQAGARASDRLYAEVGQGMRVYRADTGRLHWKKDDLKYAGPCILHNDLIITNANSYAESAGAFSITTGDQQMVKHPLTGEVTPWKMTRAYGCNNIIASENLLTFRSGAAGYYDLTTNSGTGNLGGFKSGCTSNLVVANGVLNAPDYTRTCSCSYQNQTSLALVHMPEMEVWSVNTLASASLDETLDASGALISSVGFNFGAPGDRRDGEGMLWLEYPPKAGASPPLTVEFNPDASIFSQHSASRSGDPRAWISASGIDNLTDVKLGLTLAEKVDLAKGLPVSHAEDDAEESHAGDVSLSSSDLELTDDDGDQTIGLRFTGVPLAANSGNRIKEAYLQFTADEASDVPTSLWISGVLSPDSERFASSTNDVTARDRTKEQVTWNPPAWNKVGEAGAAQRSPDLSRIVQEIVAQPAWKSGNAMAFIIGGEGKRVAVSSRGSNKDAPKLVVIADLPATDTASATEAEYEVELIFATPRGSTEPRAFDVYAQNELVAPSVTIKPFVDGQPNVPTVVVLPRIAIGEALNLRFDSKNGGASLSGVALRRLPPKSD